VQPMFAKMVLPRLGGAPTVWSVAMVFFQGALLAGYAYAHLLMRRFPLGHGALIHLGVLAAAALTLPIGITDTFGTPPASGIALWLIGLFTVSIGLPFAALSASAPLLQRWFATSGHPQASNPYVLYAASNLGSFALGGRDRMFWLATIGVNLAAFLLLALLCHGALYRRRPAPALLTEFYLWVSLGGVLGGIFAALLAPHIFNHVYEYPVLLIAALLVLPGMFAGGWRRFLGEAAPVLSVAALAIATQFVFGIRLPAAAELPFRVVLVALAGLMLLQRHRPVRFFALAALAFVLTGPWQPGFNHVETVRSFFGVHQVVETADSSHRLLLHGTTNAWRRAHKRGGLRTGTAHLLLFRGADLGQHRGGASWT
jgi:hypothetical protein